MSWDTVAAIADAVLYEGYILWPYRRSALKNQRRFTFGGVYPPTHSAMHPDDPSTMQTEVLIEGGEPSAVEIAVRFLQVVRRDVVDPDGARVDELTVSGQKYLSWEEARERSIEISWRPLIELRGGVAAPVSVPAGQTREEVGGGAALVRAWDGLSGEVRVQAEPVAADAWRLSVEIANATAFGEGGRQEALARTFCSTHTLLRAQHAAFVSMTDPPDRLADAASASRNLGTWPVLVGDPGATSTMLSSPIILEDYPRVAPESPGDLFDGGEIDALLVLNILALTDEEKAEMVASDPRAREILERTEALSPEQRMSLHGTIREFGMIR